MIELSHLVQLLAFADCGTLSGAARELHTSQPALSRSMQQLEEELHVDIFEHHKNRLVLNKNGELAVSYARRILAQTDDMVDKIRAFDRSQRTISVGSCAPAPLWTLTPLLSDACPDMTISSDMKNNDILIRGLYDGLYSFIILPEPLNEPDVYCTLYGREHLYISLPPEHPLASRKNVNFSDINGENFLLFSKIGFWYDICAKHMPDSHFIVQDEQFSFDELVKNSALPSFVTDLSITNNRKDCRRIAIPILDSAADVSYYCICTDATKNQLKRVVTEIDKISSTAKRAR